MNTPLDHETPYSGSDDLRHAEYVLGVLDAAARAAVEREIERDAQAAAEVARWQRHLLSLTEDIAPVAPPEYVWARLRDELGLAHEVRRDTSAPHSAPSLWQSLALWRIIGIGASAIAAACIVMLTVLPRAPSAPAAAQVRYLVASIRQDNGLPGWTATIDTAHARVVVVPAVPNTVAANRAPELWLIPSGGKPIAVGVFAPDKPTTLTLHRDLLAHLNARGLLAVSIEPPDGSPTGQPTGPVVAKGALSGS